VSLSVSAHSHTDIEPRCPPATIAQAKALEKEVGNAAKARERQAKENDRKLAEAKQRHRDLVSSAKEAGQRVETLTMEIGAPLFCQAF